MGKLAELVSSLNAKERRIVSADGMYVSDVQVCVLADLFVVKLGKAAPGK